MSERSTKADREKQAAERRQGSRVFIAIPVLVRGQAPGHRSLEEETHTLRVNANGGLITLGTNVKVGQRLMVINRATQEEQEFRVVYVGPKQPRKTEVGIAFDRPAPYFWRRQAKQEKQAVERRRSKRVFVPVPLTVRGKIGRKSFQEETHTLRVNAYGGLFHLAAPVKLGQELVVINNATHEEQVCRVMYLGMGEKRKTEVGVEFEESAPDFWRRPAR